MLIETVWNNIIEEEMAQTAELFPPDRIKVITNKIVALGKLYSSSQKYFPIGKSPNCNHNNNSLFESYSYAANSILTLILHPYFQNTLQKS